MGLPAPLPGTPGRIDLYDSPNIGVYAMTPDGEMWFPSRDDADYELALMFPAITINVSREPAPWMVTA